MPDLPNDLVDPSQAFEPPPAAKAAPSAPNDLVDPSKAFTGSTSSDDLSAGQAASYGLVESIPFGKSLGAAIETGESYLPKWMRAPGDAPVEQTGEGWAQRYAENRARIGAQAKALEAAYPKTTMAARAAPLLAAPELGTAGWAGYGAASGVSEGADEGDDWGGMLAKGTLGAATGAIGSEAGKLIAPAARGTRDAVLAAAKRLGVAMPRYSVGVPLTQQLGKIGFSIPGMSTPLHEATGEAIGQMGTAAETAATDPATQLGATKQSAGATMGAGLKDWIGPVSTADVDAKYNAVANQLNPNTKTPLSATLSVANQIAARRQAAGLSGMGGAVNHVTQAIQRGDGLTYNGIKDLRTSVGELMDSSALPADMSGSELKQIYGALSNDLQRSAYNAGGQRGVDLHNAATDFAKQTAQRREQLVKLLGGPQAGNSDEAVFGALQRAASTTNSADIAALRQARSVVPPQSWDSLSRGMVSTLGRDADGNFSTSRFLTDYGKISDNAKDELFAQNGQLRQNLDDLATVSRQWKGMEKYANPSGTAQHAVGAAALLHGWHAPLETLGMFLGAKTFGKLLATPAGAGAFGWFSRAVGSRNIAAVQQAAARVSATAGAQLGSRVDPMGLTALAMHHYWPEATERGDQGGMGTNPQ